MRDTTNRTSFFARKS